MRITTIPFIIPNNVACYNRFYHIFTENSIPAVMRHRVQRAFCKRPVTKGSVTGRFDFIGYSGKL